MCTTLEKFRRASDRIVLESRQQQTELLHARKELVQAVEARKLAEEESQKKDQRIMRVTRNADIANCWMCASLMVTFILCGLLVYTL